MKWALWMVAIVVVVVVSFFALKSFIYEEKPEQNPAWLSDGEYLGFIHALVDNNSAMDFDDAEWLTGVEGQNAAIAAGLCTEETRSECLPNDYFIQNTSANDARLSLASNARVFMQTKDVEETGQVGEREIPLTEFASLINDSSAHWRTLPYIITTESGAVVRINEVYIP